MDSKRKASGTRESLGNEDRAAKRRKIIEEYGDLLKNGETAESTSAYGWNILESIRATTDKHGRPVSPYFEKLPSRRENPDYYKKIRLPLSLELIEQKLKNGQYSNLSALESDFKRLVSNAKDINERTSVAFGDAERVRKAVSNLMTKHNPAYKRGNYQAVPTPLPPTPEPDDVAGEDDAEGEEEEEDEDVAAKDVPTQEDEVDGEDEEEVEIEEEVVEDEQEEEEAGEEAGEEVEEDDEEDEDEEDEDGDEEDDDGEPDSPVRERRRPGRPPKNPAAHARKVAARGPTPGKADTHYENKGYKGLNFQQAQEKIVEELLRLKDEAGFPYYEPFIYLPPRTLKDYYDIIAEPLSLKALQKQVRGQHGRGGATYVSDFKGWAAFEDQASLIWKNAYHYNEDGSEIYSMAQELEQSFAEQIKEARAHVPEPPQPKIKIKMPPNSETPQVHPKKITIHVGGKTSVAGSPAPATGQSGEGEFPRNSTPAGRNPFGGSTATSVSLSQLEKARSMSTSAGPPSPRAAVLTKAEDVVRPSPAFNNHQQFAPPVMPPSTPAPNTAAVIPPPLPAPKLSAQDILEAQKYRPYPIDESEALLPQLVITSHPSLQIEQRLSIKIQASPTECQQNLIFQSPSSHFRLQLRPQVASFLEEEQREWKLNVMHDAARLYPSQPYEKRNEPVFDATLKYGSNRLEVSLVAALPKGQKAPNGLNMELERFVIHFNLLRHS